MFDINSSAVVLCGGKGTRLGVITRKTPKSLVKILGKPIIWYVIKFLIKNKINNIIFPLGYKGSLIKNYMTLNFKSHLNKFKFIYTGRDTEITGRLIKIKKLIKKESDFLILNSDTIYNFNIKKMITEHNLSNKHITFAGTNIKSDWGSFVVSKKKLILKKFVKNKNLKFFILDKYEKYFSFRNMGVSIINWNCFNLLKNKKFLDFEKIIFNIYIKKKIANFIYFNSFWYPVETAENINKTIRDKNIRMAILNIKNKFNKVK